MRVGPALRPAGLSASMSAMRLLFLENHDSFSWNVIESLPCERRDVVIRPGREAAGDSGALRGFDAVVIGPGPTDPERAGIVEVVRAAARAGLPLLGICLGHQALGLAFGARLTPVRPAHGKLSAVRFSASRLFPSFAGPEVVMRYHSLALADVATPLRVVARTDDGIPMAIEHETLPMAGLQFHPDSYGTPRGREMVAGFFRVVA
jgi:anthranilate synthase/aminodeoxychorismate synthase-like glutamine amidotransferase